MSNKLTALTAATLPLAGTEAVYVVQGGNSRQTTAAAVIASCSIIANNETITGTKTYNSGKLQLAGSTSGVTILNATAAASGTLTLPAATDTLVARNTTDTLTNKTINGANNTITNVSLTTGVTGILPIANGGWNAADVGTGRLNFTLPVYTTYAGLAGLDTTKDKAAICTDINLGRGGNWDFVSSSLTAKTIIQTGTTTSISGNVITLANHNLSTGAGVLVTTAVDGLSTQTVYWVINLSSSTFSLATTPENAIASTAITLTGTTNFTFQQLLDPLQDIYVIPTGFDLAGSQGAWVRSGGQSNYGAFRANYNRFNDRVLIGTGATRWMGDHSGTMAGSGAGSWMHDEVPAGGSQIADYLLINAGLASVSGYDSNVAPYAIVGASRTPGGTSSQNAIGVAGYGSGHATGGASVVWGSYSEGRKVAGSNSTAQGAEIEVTNLSSTVTSPVFAPASTYVQGETIGLFLGSGGGNTTGTVFDSDIAMWIGANGAKFRTGIGFSTGALTQDASTNYQHAIMLPTKARLEWYASGNNTDYGYTIHSEVSTLANSHYWIAKDGDFFMQNQAGGIYARISTNTNAAGNYVRLTASNPGTGVTVAANGGDTNIDLILSPKGTGAVRAASAILSSSASGGVGYSTGAGGTVTQATSRTTGVTLNTASGAITMFSAAGSATAATFTVTNSAVAATDTIVLNQKSGTNLYNFIVTAVAAGSFNITFYTTGGTATDAPVINFAVVKAVAA